MLALHDRADVTVQLFWPDGRSRLERGGSDVIVPPEALAELIFHRRLTSADFSLLEQPAVVGVAALSDKTTDQDVVDICTRFGDLRTFRLPAARKVGAPGMAAIVALADVRAVQLVGARLGSADCRPLGALEKLSRLTLERCGLTDGQVADISESRGLEHLDLTGNRLLTDDCLRHVGRMARLEQLLVAGCRFTDSGLEHLEGAATLRGLHLSSTQVTAAGVRRLNLPSDALVTLPDGAEIVPVEASLRRAAPAAELPARLRVEAPLLLVFTSPYCGPCRTTKTRLGQLPSSLRERFKVVEVDVTMEPALGRRFTVDAIPTLVLMHGGEEHFRIVGAGPAAQLQTALTSALDTLAPAR